MSGEGVISSNPGKRHNTRFRRGMVICPVCYADGRIEGSEHVSDLVKTLWIACSNVTCGQTWRMQLAFEYVISPSAIARADLALPQAPADFKRTTYPSGPPGGSCAPDPDQFDMFEPEQFGGADEPEPDAADHLANAL